MKKMFDLLGANWKSGLTVSLVSMPLSLALAIASGATPAQGIITAFWAGFVGALFAGSNYNIIGPTGALSGILIAYALTSGFATLPFIAIAAGIFIFIAYIFHLDRYIIFIPRSVVHGFTLGVAFIIGLGQLDNALGIKNFEKTDNVLLNVIAILKNISEAQWEIFGLFAIGTIFIFLWNKKFPKLPGAIVLAGLGIAVSILMNKGFIGSMDITTLADKYPDLNANVFTNIWSNFSLTLLANKKFWIISLTTALIAILETLLSGQIAETITGKKFDRKKEVFALGMANVASGLAGGIPATAALARTALNIKSGATHKTSAGLNAIFLLGITFILLPYFRWLPMVTVASILVYVAIAMVEKKHFIHLIENEKIAFGLSIVVAVITVAEDPIIGILVGTVIALMIFVHNISKGQTEILLWKDGRMHEAVLKDHFITKQDISSDLVVYKISGALTYINMPAHLEAVERIKNNKFVIISLRHAFYIDSDGVEYLNELIEILKSQNEKVILTGVNPIIEKKIHKEEFYRRKLIEQKIYSHTSEAIHKLYVKHTAW